MCRCDSRHRINPRSTWRAECRGSFESLNSELFSRRYSEWKVERCTRASNDHLSWNEMRTKLVHFPLVPSQVHGNLTFFPRGKKKKKGRKITNNTSPQTLIRLKFVNICRGFFDSLGHSFRIWITVWIMRRPRGRVTLFPFQLKCHVFLQQLSIGS